MRSSSSLLAQAVTLSTGKGRLTAFVALSSLIYITPYGWLSHLSFWQAIGWHSAPSIGLTRAYWLMLHLKPGNAWHRNHLIYVVLGVGLPMLCIDLLQFIHKKSYGKAISDTPML